MTASNVQHPQRYAPLALETWTAAVLEGLRVPPGEARTAAGLLVRSDLRGYETHGLARLGSYVDRLASGEFNPTPALRLHESPGIVDFDADGAMGHVAAPAALDAGLARLGTEACVFVAVRRCGHLGALGIHALRAAEAGAFCMAGQRTPPRLAMPGFSTAAIGHNPIAFACPLAGSDPVVFDVACSVAARGHIMQAAREGRSIPQGWAVDVQGLPTTDPEAALEGYLLPVGGHKGLGLAMMVEVLAGAFAASASRPAPEVASAGGAGGYQGAFFLLLRPGAVADRSVFDEAMAQWTRHYLAAGGQAARLPGHRGAALERERRVAGIALMPALERELRAAGEKVGVPFDAQPLPDR